MEDNRILSWVTRVEEDIRNDFYDQYPVIEETGVTEKIEQLFSETKESVLGKIEQDDPYAKQKKQINELKDFLESEKDLTDIDQYVDEYCKCCNDDFGVWKKTLSDIKNKKNKDNEEIKTFGRLIIHKWERHVDQGFERWSLMQIEEYRRNILEKIGGWLKLLQQIKETMDALSMDTGLLFDMSQGVPSVQDIEEIKKWVEYIRQNQSIKELCEMLGKMRSIEESERADRVEAVVEYENMVKNTSSKEEYIGLKLGNDIENIVKSELALLDGSELELLFDKKFVERQLLCFDMVGFTNMVESKVENKEQNVLEKDKCGPIIVCVDTSGSMSGMPETIAKAITLYMAFHARKQDRACYLVNFSTQIEEMDFSKNMNCEQFVTFLRKSFHGGTDATPALRAAIQKVQSNQYEKADILMISDFIMPELGSEMLESMDATRTTGNRFYALSICRDDIPGMSTGAFDDIYVYDSFSGGLSSMMSFTRNVTQRR